jgi:hypothetical protein
MISESQLMLSTALPDVYKKLVDDEKLFAKRHHLFAFGLCYGLLHNLRYDKKANSDMVAVSRISKDEVSRDIIDIIFELMDDGKSTANTVFNEMLQIADGGVLELKKIYDKNKSFTIHNLLTESEALWEERIDGFHNINISKATT